MAIRDPEQAYREIIPGEYLVENLESAKLTDEEIKGPIVQKVIEVHRIMIEAYFRAMGP